MNPITPMPSEYLAIAAERAAAECTPHFQPEAFKYKFHSWVSPYTKGANQLGGFAFVLQDWASEDGLREFRTDIQTYGRTPELLTNKRLEALLQELLGLALSDVYVTNAFPFVKRGGMSAPLKAREVRRAARRFLARELQLVKPKRVFALGAVAQLALEACEIPCIRLPHPAARFGFNKHASAWKSALRKAGIDCGQNNMLPNPSLERTAQLKR